MQPTCLHIRPVYSEEHFDPSQRLGSMLLLKHQVATLEAFNDPEVDVIFNTAMTGDGKSLAAYLPVFQEQKSVIAMYPTNELVQDQYGLLPKYHEAGNVHLPKYDTMYSDKITQLMREHNTLVRLEEVRKLLKRNKILLTNPDLIHLIMSHQYGWDYLRKDLPATVGAYFDYFLFDEFHIFGVPQVISVMNMLGYLDVTYRDKPNERRKFLFLSATPSKLMDKLLERGGFRYKKIEGSYQSTAQSGYRCILQPCELELHAVSQETPTETWIEEHLEEIQHFFEQYPQSRAAVLVYSVATARRLYTRLKAYFEPLGITVGENTGLTHWSDRAKSRKKHILVGTTTVDIGVDFDINYLIFEAYNAGSFLQRFGRLGRHTGFDAYRAHALIPSFVQERLASKFAERGDVERTDFNNEVREAFPVEQEFERYIKRWGVVQAAQVLAELQNEGRKGRDANQGFTEALTEQYEQFYGSGNSEEPIIPKALKKYWALKKRKPQILEELQSFRGQSPLSCGVWDTDGHLKTYDLFFLLANTEFEVLEEKVFMQEVEKRNLEQREFRNQLLYLKVHQYVAERQQMVLKLPYDLGDYAAQLHQAQVLNTFFVSEPRHTWLSEVNRKVKNLKLTCIVSDMLRRELKQRLNLSSMFPIYRLQDSTGNEYSVAFGQEALLLESLLFWRKTSGDKMMML